MKITAIERQKRRQHRVSLFLDEEFWVGMSEKLWEDLGIKNGQEISPEKKVEIENAAVEDGALDYALTRLAERSYTERQIADRLEKRGYGERVVELVLEKCREYLLLDDRSFAETLIEERKARGYGRRWLQNKLREKGVADDMSKELLDAAFQPDEEAEEARAALQGKYGSGILLPDVAQRALGFLLRRGFSPAAARSAVAEQSADAATREKLYGPEEAMLALRKRYGASRPEDDKVWAYLMRKGFSSATIRQVLQESE